MKLTSLSIAIGASILAAIPLGGALAQDEITFKYGTFYSPTDFYEVPSKFFMEEVTKRSDGRIKFEPYYGGSLLKARELSPGVSAGAVDIAVTVPGAFEPEQFPLTGVTLPYVTTNPYATTTAFRELYESDDRLKDEYQSHGQELLYAMGSGGNTLWTNKKVSTQDDLRGQRIRVTLGIADALNALGATPVGIPWSEALDLIQRGGVDGVSATPFDQAVKTGLGDIIPYVTDAGGSGSYAVVTVVMNKAKWDGLDQETKNLMSEVASEIPAYYVRELDKEIDTQVEKLAGSKATVVRLSDEEAAKWKEIGGGAARDVWMGRAKRSVEDPQAFFDKYEELVKAAEEEHPFTPGIERLNKQ